MTTPAAAPSWPDVVARAPLDRAARLVAGLLADRADDAGRVRVPVAELAASACLPVTRVADALADLASCGFVARDGQGRLVLTGTGVDP